MSFVCFFVLLILVLILILMRMLMLILILILILITRSQGKWGLKGAFCVFFCTTHTSTITITNTNTNTNHSKPRENGTQGCVLCVVLCGIFNGVMKFIRSQVTDMNIHIVCFCVWHFQYEYSYWKCHTQKSLVS